MSGLADILGKWATPPAELVSKLPRGGTQLDYMGHAAVTRALIDVDYASALVASQNIHPAYHPTIETLEVPE